MPMCLCSVCDRPFDANKQVEAQYDPPVCEDCIYENRRFETGTSEETRPQAQAVETSRLVRGSNHSISKGLGRI